MKIEINSRYKLNKCAQDESRYLDIKSFFNGLRNKLIAAGYSPASFCLGEDLGSDRLILCEDGEFWSVFHTEKGSRFEPAFFVNIDDAVHFFLWKLSNGKVFNISDLEPVWEIEELPDLVSNQYIRIKRYPKLIK